MPQNLNCYNLYPKEERKLILDFIDQGAFAYDELSNLMEFHEKYDGDIDVDGIDQGRHDEKADKLQTVVDTLNDYLEALEKYFDAI